MTKPSSRKNMSNQTSTFIEEDYQRLLREVYAEGTWFKTPHEFLLILNFGETYFLAYLINVAYCVNGPEGRNDGWFYHTHKQIEEKTFIPKWKQDRLIASLKKKGYIETELRGLPAKRYFRIDYIKIRKRILKKRKEKESAIEGQDIVQTGVTTQQPLGVTKPRQQGVSESLQQGVSESLHHKRSSTLTGTKKKQNNIVARPDGRDDGKKSRSSLGLGGEDTDQEVPVKNQWATHLYEELRKTRKVMRRVKPAAWAKEFGLLEKDLVDAGENRDDVQSLIWKVLRWYTNNIGKEYIPDARSASAFREKFDNINAAMEREGTKEAKKGSPDEIIKGRTRRQWYADGDLPPGDGW